MTGGLLEQGAERRERGGDPHIHGSEHSGRIFFDGLIHPTPTYTESVPRPHPTCTEVTVSASGVPDVWWKVGTGDVLLPGVFLRGLVTGARGHGSCRSVSDF